MLCWAAAFGASANLGNLAMQDFLGLLASRLRQTNRDVPLESEKSDTLSQVTLHKNGSLCGQWLS